MKRIFSFLVVFLLLLPLTAQSQQNQQIPASEHQSLIRAFAFSEILLNDSYYGVIAVSNLSDNHRPWYESDRDILVLGFLKETVEAVVQSKASTGTYGRIDLRYDRNDLVMMASSVVFNRIGTGLYNWIRHGRFQLHDWRFNH